MDKSNNLYWVWLSSLVKITPKKRFELLEYFKDPVYIWHATQEELECLEYLSKNDLTVIMDKNYRTEASVHYENICCLDIDIVTLYSPEYPSLLKCIYDPPTVIYAKGHIDSVAKNIAVVGSRRATQYGLDTSAKLAFGMSGYGITVSSGMARGIDTYAHKGAIKAGGRTIAVLGCGLDRAYPPENKRLMQQICENGAVISEFLPGTPPLAYNFPARNRIISGISLGVIIVEASEKSGSLITTDYALEQGREVFAVPGNIDSLNSVGTNRLIRDGAKIVTDIYDVLDELGINHEEAVKSTKPVYPYLDNDEKQIVKCLQKGGLNIDEISQRCGLEINIASSILLMLELKTVVEQLPGKHFKLYK